MEPSAVDHLARWVDREPGIRGAPLAGAVEVLEREPDRIHNFVAGGAHGIAAMLLHPIANRSRLHPHNGFSKRRNVRRRQRWRTAQNIFENPLATLDG